MADGTRTSKVVDGVTHTYYYSGNKLLRETYGSTVLDFFYDANGTPIAMKQNGAVYYYITNLQGDVVRLVNSAGNTAAWYKYDPYGNATTASGSHATINPLRYRGYYYDTETGLYYCQSRYYDPTIGRFINADVLVSAGTILGHNLFAYCENSPVICKDDSGFGKIYVIYYEREDNGFEEQAKNSPYYTSDSEDVVMIGVTTNQEFVDAWNSIEGNVDNVYLYLHGGMGVLYFYNEELSFPYVDNNTSSLSFGDLESKSISEGIYLFSCDGGYGGVGSNVALMFADLADTKVRACTGHFSYSEIGGKYYARKARDHGLWYTIYYHDSYLFSSLKYAVYQSVSYIA